MELRKLRISNFLGIGEGELAFDKSCLVLVEGVNHDSPSSLSNGAGKSSIFEALFWVLFGKTKRGLVGDDVINNVAGKNCVVELEFDRFKVVRSRRHDVLGTSLRLFQLGANGDSPRDLTLGTVKDTQKLIEDTIKLSEFSFSKIAYFGQGDIRGFAGLSDSELKRVFEQALGLAFFADYQDRVKAYRIDLEVRLRDMTARQQSIGRERVFASEKLELMRHSLKECEQRTKEDRERLESGLREIERELTEIESNARQAESELLSRKRLVEAQGIEKGRLDVSRRRLDELIKASSEALIRRQMQNVALAAEVRSIEFELKELENRVGMPCGECGKPYRHEDITSVKVNLKLRLKDRREACSAGAAEEKSIRRRFEKLSRHAAKLESKIYSFSAVASEMLNVKARNDHWRRVLVERAPVLAEKERETRAALERLSLEGASGKYPLLEQVAFQESHVKELSAESSRLERQIDAGSREVATAKVLEEILGNGGLKSYIFDAITPRLNRLIDRNIKKLDDIDIEVSTVTKLKSGDFREKFAINVNNRHGAGTFEGNSGGELQKINLAISLAVNSLVRSVSEGSINAMFLDECFENLDEGSSERVLDLVQDLEAPNVFLITHRPAVKELVSTVVRVEKRGGMAYIV